MVAATAVAAAINCQQPREHTVCQRDTRGAHRASRIAHSADRRAAGTGRTARSRHTFAAILKNASWQVRVISPPRTSLLDTSRRNTSRTSRPVRESGFSSGDRAIKAGDVAGAGWRRAGAATRCRHARREPQVCATACGVRRGALSLRCSADTHCKKGRGEIPARTSETRACAAARRRTAVGALVHAHLLGVGPEAADPRMRAHVPTHARAPRPRRAQPHAPLYTAARLCQRARAWARAPARGCGVQVAWPFPSLAAWCPQQHGAVGEGRPPRGRERLRAAKMRRRGCESAALVWRRARVHTHGSAGHVPAALHVFCLLDGAPQVQRLDRYLLFVLVYLCRRACKDFRGREKGRKTDRQNERL